VHQGETARGHGLQALARGLRDLFEACGEDEAGQGHAVLVDAETGGEVGQLARFLGALTQWLQGGERVLGVRLARGDLYGGAAGGVVRARGGGVGPLRLVTASVVSATEAGGSS
jgi:hypothetical protein